MKNNIKKQVYEGPDGLVCSGTLPSLNTDKDNPMFKTLADNSVVFENGRQFVFNGKKKRIDLVVAIWWRLSLFRAKRC